MPFASSRRAKAATSGLCHLAASLEHELAEIERKIKELVAGRETLKKRFELLQSIPGIGPVCAEAILFETGGFARFARVAEAVAFAGLSPRERSSGASTRGRASISRQGNSRLRRLLYLPAMAAKRCNPVVARLARRLEAKGKPGKVVLCACMKKLLQIAFGVLKHGKDFDPNYKKSTRLTSKTVSSFQIRRQLEGRYRQQTCGKCVTFTASLESTSSWRRESSLPGQDRGVAHTLHKRRKTTCGT